VRHIKWLIGILLIPVVLFLASPYARTIDDKSRRGVAGSLRWLSVKLDVGRPSARPKAAGVPVRAKPTGPSKTKVRHSHRPATHRTRSSHRRATGKRHQAQVSSRPVVRSTSRAAPQSIPVAQRYVPAAAPVAPPPAPPPPPPAPPPVTVNASLGVHSHTSSSSSSSGPDASAEGEADASGTATFSFGP